MKIFNKFYYFVCKKHKWILSRIEYPQIYIENSYYCFMSYSNQNLIVCADAFSNVNDLRKSFSSYNNKSKEINLNGIVLYYKSYVQSL